MSSSPFLCLPADDVLRDVCRLVIVADPLCHEARYRMARSLALVCASFAAVVRSLAPSFRREFCDTAHHAVALDVWRRMCDNPHVEARVMYTPLTSRLFVTGVDDGRRCAIVLWLFMVRERVTPALERTISDMFCKLYAAMGEHTPGLLLDLDVLHLTWQIGMTVRKDTADAQRQAFCRGVRSPAMASLLSLLCSDALLVGDGDGIDMPGFYDCTPITTLIAHHCRRAVASAE